MIQKYHGAKYFSKIDLTFGYWQLKLHKDSRKYTAFLHNSILYQFVRVPFGFKDAGSAFMRMLSIVVGDEKKDISRFIDDLFIASKTFEEHMNALRWLFERLMKAGLTVKLEKCEFFQTSIRFLGFILSADGITPDPEKLSVIANFEEPKNKSQLQSILGFCNFYRQFSLAHATFVDHLRNLLKNDNIWNWTADHAEAFKNLKQNFLNSSLYNIIFLA